MARKTKSVPARASTVDGLFHRVVAILEQARSRLVRSINSEMVLAYWHIGREIVQVVQAGDARAEYGQGVLEALAARLHGRYVKGFSVTNLRYFRLFYQIYSSRVPEIRHKARDESATGGKPAKKHHKACDVLDDLSLAIEHADRMRGFASGLSWSHYRTLTKVENEAERLFYEIEAEKGGGAFHTWSGRCTPCCSLG